MGLQHCRHRGLVTVQDEARLIRGHNDQSRQGHQCSETTLTGESRFHLGTPLGIEPRSLMTGSKRVLHWTSETWYECSDIAGFPQYCFFFSISSSFSERFLPNQNQVQVNNIPFGEYYKIFQRKATCRLHPVTKKQRTRPGDSSHPV